MGCEGRAEHPTGDDRRDLHAHAAIVPEVIRGEHRSSRLTAEAAVLLAVSESGNAAEAEEERPGRDLFATGGHAAQVSGAVDRLELRVQPHLDALVGLDALDEVGRHRLRERGATHEHRHVRAEMRE